MFLILALVHEVRFASLLQLDHLPELRAFVGRLGANEDRRMIGDHGRVIRHADAVVLYRFFDREVQYLEFLTPFAQGVVEHDLAAHGPERNAPQVFDHIDPTGLGITGAHECPAIETHVAHTPGRRVAFERVHLVLLDLQGDLEIANPRHLA